MKTLLSLLQDEATRAIEQIYGSRGIALFLPAEVTQSTHERFGHYQCNTPLKLGKFLHENPRAVAETIVNHLNTQELYQRWVSSAEIAGPGFINFSIDQKAIAKDLNVIFKDPLLGLFDVIKREKIVVDFSAPNVAKELHVGHLRSTIIGDCLARFFEFCGHDVLRLNHIGDWGTQFGMLIAYLKREVPEVLKGKDTDLPSLMKWYQASKKRLDEDPLFKKQAQLEVVKLQQGDPLSLQAWEKICDISRKAYSEVYALLDIKITERGESFYKNRLPDLVSDLEKKHLITLSEGAKCVFLEGFTNKDGTPLPLIVQKTDGAYNYDTTDLAALRQRIEDEKADRVIYVIDAGQSLHCQMVFKAAEKAGYLDPRKVRVEHVAFGVVLGPDGKKFKTRSGFTEKLIDLLLEAISHAKSVLAERLPDVSEEEVNRSAKILGIDALKYADLSCHRIKDYLFSYERMLKLEGNTAAFLLYAFVRIQGIKRKVDKHIEEMRAEIALEHPSEIALGLHLRQFGETLQMIDRDLLPNRLCDYLYQLAEKFHLFFRDCRVEGSELEDSRLLLCELTGKILSKGLELLGCKTLDRM